jgi:hypothetical protein
MRTDDETDTLRRGIRADLVIAVCALLVSGLATAASLWQSHVVAQQLGAQVWPYLSFNENYDSRSLELTVENDGLGPAVMRSVVASFDGRSQADVVALLRSIVGPHAKRPGGRLSITMTSSAPGSVLRPGVSVTVVALRGDTLPAGAVARLKRLALSACYCSIEGDCWTVDSTHSDPTRAANCPQVAHNLMQWDIPLVPRDL